MSGLLFVEHEVARAVKRTPLRADLMLKSIDTAPPGKYAARFARLAQATFVCQTDVGESTRGGSSDRPPDGVRAPWGRGLVSCRVTRMV